MQTINGTFIQNLPLVEGDSNRGHWVRGGFVIEYGDDYPRKVAFSSFGEDKVNAHRNIPGGTPVQVRFSPESREYNGKWYTDLRCISIAPLAQSAAYAPTQQTIPTTPTTPTTPNAIQPNPKGDANSLFNQSNTVSNLGFDNQQQTTAPYLSTFQAPPAPVAMPAEKDDDLPF